MHQIRAVFLTALNDTSYTSYAWSRLEGKAGSDGVPGTSLYIHIRYSANSNGNPMTTTPAAYIGVAVTGSATAPTSHTSYTWAKLTGDKGDKGENVPQMPHFWLRLNSINYFSVKYGYESRLLTPQR